MKTYTLLSRKMYLTMMICIAMMLIAVIPSLTIAQLTGVRTIGSGGNYATFGAAVADLRAQGVSGPVTFNVLNGSYNEQISIKPPITGLSATNTVTFKSNSGTASDVTLYFTPTASNNYVVDVDSVSYITFDKMTITASGSAAYGVVFELRGTANHISITNNVLNSVSTTANSGNLALILVATQPVKFVTVSGNTMNNGSYGIYFAGVSGNLSTGTVISNNVLNPYYTGIYLAYHDAPAITGNTINNIAYIGMEVDYSTNRIQILKNRITSNVANYGITMGQSIGGAGFPNLPGLIANNFIANSSPGGVYGVYLSSSSNMNLYNNSVNMTGGATTSAALYCNAGSGDSLRNNIFSNPGGGYAYNIATSASIALTDYNDFYTTGNYVAVWNGVGVSDLTALRVTSGKEANSVSYNPVYTSATDLHSASPWINNKGTPVTDVLDDFDGQVRSALTPDIGADEYTPAAGTTTPLAGTYTIGGGGATYASFNAALADLLLKGVSAPVMFNVNSGTYNEHIILTDIPGSNGSNVVSFQASTNNAANVTLYYTATAPESNYVVRLNGARYVRFHKMTLLSNNVSNATYSRIFELAGGWGYLTVDSTVLSGAPNAGNSGNQALIGSSAGGTSKSLVINGNSFTNDSYGVYVIGINGSAQCKNTQITNNTFTNFYYGIYLSYHDSPLISGNTVTNATYIGITVDYSTNNIQILKNKVTGGALNYGITMGQSTGGAGFPNLPGLIANNFIANSSPGGVYGLYLSSSSNMNLYNNSVNMTGAATTSAAFYCNAGGGMNIENNIFSNPGGGYAYNVPTSASIALTDYNDVFTTGNYVALWNNAGVGDLAALRVTSSQEASSVSYSPIYTTATNLHSASPWINNKGTALLDVADDIDGQARNGSTPDIGADEFTPAAGSTTPLSGTYTIGAAGIYTTFNAALADLNLKGISAPVTFNVLTGVYNEHIILTDIPGTSPSNVVSFQASTNNAANATLFFFAAVPESNYVVRINGARYLRFHKMTLRSNNASNAPYSRVFELMGGWSHLTFDSTVLSGAPNAGNSGNQALIVSSAGGTSKSLVINGNSFTNDSYGVSVIGISGSAQCKNTQITNNTFTNFYYGIYLSYHDSPLISGNTVTNATYIGITVDYSTNNIQILTNKITGGALNYGITMYQSTGGAGFPNLPGLIANNFIANSSAGAVQGLNLNTTSNVNLYHNSVNMTGAATTSAAFYCNAGGGINLENNIFSNPGGGYAYNVPTSASIALTDYNDVFTTGNYVALWNAVGVADLAALRVTTAQDANSVSYNPIFTSATDLHTISPWINNKGTPLGDVTDDIDGQPRDGSTPDIGADEYTIVAGTTPPLAGPYTIGTGGSYPTFKAAVADLLLRGVSAPVTFNVITGSYNEHIVLTDISGTSTTNTVTFQAQTGNAANATLYFSAAAPESNYVVKLNGAHYLRFHKMTFLSNNASNATYSRVFELLGGWNYLTIDSTVLSGAPNAGNSVNQALIGTSAGATPTSCIITGNTFSSDSYGVNISGINGSALCKNIQVTNNTFSGFYTAIYLPYHDSPVVSGNSVTNVSYDGIAIDYSLNGIQILKNKINSATANFGISLYQSTGGAGFPNLPGLIANNFVAISSAGNPIGIQSYYGSNLKIYHNSVNMTGSTVSSLGLYIIYGNAGSIDIINNIFSNPGGGYAYYMYSPATVDTTNYNDVYSSGTRIAYWAGDQATLTALRTASGKEANSVSVNPAFFSNTNLHTVSSALDSAGTPLASVTDDIDGLPRHPIKPDIGATEFSLTIVANQPLINGWNLVSIPLTVADARKTTLYPTATSRAYFWQAGAYVLKDTLRNRAGYWLKFSSAQLHPIGGGVRLRDTISVSAGWNMIGGITYPMPKSAIIQSPLSNVKSNYYYYTATGYLQADTIKPAIGYWVKTGTVGTLVFDVNQTSASPVLIPKETESLNLAGFNVLTVEKIADAAQAKAQLFFTRGDESNSALDEFTVPPPPPAGAFDLRFSSNRLAESFTIDGTPRRELPFVINGGSGKVSLSWVISDGNAVRYVIVEKQAGEIIGEHAMNPGGSLTLDLSNDHSYFLRMEELPAQYSLSQNFPNPFNPMTSIQFGLADRSTVTLKIFNILGQTVATPIANQSMDKGSHSLDIDARNWVSGIYFYQITAGSYTKVKKMVLVK